MNVLIIGGGQLGRKTAELLDLAGHAACLLVQDPDELSLLPASYGGMTAVGFPMDVRALKNAGIESCDAVGVVTGDDNLNITVGQMARDAFGISKVITRITDPRRETVFQSFGLESICPTNMAADKLFSALTDGSVNRQLNFGVTTVSLGTRKADKREIGHPAHTLPLEQGQALFGVLRKNGSFSLQTPGESLVLAEGDSLVLSRTID